MISHGVAVLLGRGVRENGLVTAVITGVFGTENGGRDPGRNMNLLFMVRAVHTR